VADTGGTGGGWWGVFGVAESGQKGDIAADVTATFDGLQIAL
jgi:hypothetical protein